MAERIKTKQELQKELSECNFELASKDIECVKLQQDLINANKETELFKSGKAVAEQDMFTQLVTLQKIVRGDAKPESKIEVMKDIFKDMYGSIVTGVN